MELVESAQKLAPWLGHLPFAHKMALTVMIASISAFFLFVIWLPVPPLPDTSEVKGERIVGGQDALTIIVNASGAAVDSASQFVHRIDDPSIAQKIASNSERDELKKVIHDLVTIEFSQAPLPWLLRMYAKESDPKNWGQVKMIVAVNSPIILELQSLLRKFDGNLIFKDLDTYKMLFGLTETRAGLYGTLSSMPAPTSAEDKQKLLMIANNFEKLINQIKIVQQKLAIYLRSSASESPMISR